MTDRRRSQRGAQRLELAVAEVDRDAGTGLVPAVTLTVTAVGSPSVGVVVATLTVASGALFIRTVKVAV